MPHFKGDKKKFTKKEAAKLDSKYKRAPKRVLVKKTGIIPDNAIRGVVTAAIGKVFHLLAHDGSKHECVLGGTVISAHDKSSLIAAGDYAWFISGVQGFGDSAFPGVIVKVEERESLLSRKGIYNPNEHVLAANVACLIILMAAANPKYNKRLIDRYLVSSEQGDMEPLICINKMDMGNPELISADLEIYRELGYPIFLISAKNKEGLGLLEDFLAGRGAVLSGPSGAGKSTLINALFNEEVQKVGDISEKTAKGRHTTSFAKMFFLPHGGRIIDTPGLRELGIIELPKNELALYFHDFDDYRESCKFMPCTHTHEPGCEVKKAVEDGVIDYGRYLSYINIYDSLED